MSTFQVHKLLSSSPTTNSLAICEITGIAVTLDIPAIPGIVLTYSNPLALKSNFLALAELPKETLFNCEPLLLSGLLLAIWKHSDLVACPLSSAAQNLSLQSLHKNILIENIKFFSSSPFLERVKEYRKLSSIRDRNDLEDSTPEYRKDLAFGEIEDFPKISLTPKDYYEVQKSSLSEVVGDFKQACRDILFPPTVKSEEDTERLELAQIYRIKNEEKNISKAILRARTTKKNIQQDIMKEGRVIVKELIAENILSPKLTEFIKILFTGDFLVTAESAMKLRISTALLKHTGSNNAIKLSKIIISNEAIGEAEAIFSKPEDLDYKLPTKADLLENNETLENSEAEVPELPAIEASISTTKIVETPKILTIRERLLLKKQQKASIVEEKGEL